MCIELAPEFVLSLYLDWPLYEEKEKQQGRNGYSRYAFISTNKHILMSECPILMCVNSDL